MEVLRTLNLLLCICYHNVTADDDDDTTHSSDGTDYITMYSIRPLIDGCLQSSRSAEFATVQCSYSKPQSQSEKYRVRAPKVIICYVCEVKKIRRSIGEGDDDELCIIYNWSLLACDMPLERTVLTPVHKKFFFFFYFPYNKFYSKHK